MPLTRPHGRLGGRKSENDLREVEFDDVAIRDIEQVMALFNDYTRLAEGLGVAPKPPARDARPTRR